MHEFGAIGHAYLATYLREAGVRVEIDPRTGLSYLPDIPEAMVDLFSSRRASKARLPLGGLRPRKVWIGIGLVRRIAST